MRVPLALVWVANGPADTPGSVDAASEDARLDGHLSRDYVAAAL